AAAIRSGEGAGGGAGVDGFVVSAHVFRAADDRDLFVAGSDDARRIVQPLPTGCDRRVAPSQHPVAESRLEAGFYMRNVDGTRQPAHQGPIGSAIHLTQTREMST